MRFQVPYLSRLAGKASEPATLRPPRQLFVGESSMAAGSAVGEGHPGRPADGGLATGPRSQLTAPLSPFAAVPGEELEGAPRAGGTGAAPPGRDPEAPIPSAPIRPSGPGRSPAAPDASRGSTTGQSLRIVDPGSAMPGLPPLAVPPGGPARAGNPRAVTDPARGRTPASWADPLWQAPVELPPAVEPASVTGDPAPRAPVTSGRGPARGRSGSRTIDAAESPPGQVADDDISVTLGHHVSAGGPGRREAIPATGGRRSPDATIDPGGSEAFSATGGRQALDATGDRRGPGALSATGGRDSPAAIGGAPGSRSAAGSAAATAAAAVNDLRPPASGSRSLGADSGGSGPDGSSPTRPTVSIGTIEVTVVAPPDAPAPTHDPRAAQAVRNRSRPAPRPGANPGVDRLRDGRRHWYGIAQG